MSEGYVYICRREKSVSGLVKIGHTDDLERRVAEFNRETGADSKMILEVAFACAADLRHSLERAAHRHGRKHRSRGEWFRLSLDEAIETVRTAAAELGINAAICFKKDQPQEVTDRIRRQSDQEFAERCRQREDAAAQAETAKVAARIDAHIATAMQAKACLDEHCLTIPTFRISKDHEELIARTKEHAWQTATTTAIRNAEANVSSTIRHLPYLISGVGTFIWMSFLDLRSAKTSFILTIIAILGSFFYAIGVFARFVKLAEIQGRARDSVCTDMLPEVEAMRVSCLEQAKAASVAAWNARRDELTAACQQATERLDAVLLDRLKFDTRRALDGLGSKVAHNQETLLGKPYALIESILCKAYHGRSSANRWHQDMDDFLIASHAIEFNNYAEAIIPAQYDAGGTFLSGFDVTHPASNITNTDAEETIARLTTGNTNATEATALAEAIDVYRNMISNLQGFVVNKGLETQKTIDHWRELFHNYTPIDREYGRHGTYGAGEIPGTSGFLRRETGSHGPIISPLDSTLNFGMNLVKRGEMATITQILLNFARTNAPIIVPVTGERKPIWIVNTLAPIRTIKLVNVYTVTQADGATSPEYYNRDKAKCYADIQQVKWSAANPDLAAEQSPVRVDFLGPLKRVATERSPPAMSNKNVLVIPENGINHAITFNEQSEVAMAILACFTDYPQSEAYFHRAS